MVKTGFCNSFCSMNIKEDKKINKISQWRSIEFMPKITILIDFCSLDVERRQGL